MLITAIIIAAVTCTSGTGFAARQLRKRNARLKAESAAREAEAAAGREAYPVASKLLGRHGFTILDGRPRPAPQMRGKLSLSWARGSDGQVLKCEFTHEEIWKARREHRDDYDCDDDYRRYHARSDSSIVLIEQVVAQGGRAEYRKICSVCRLCLHVFPISGADASGTAFEGHLEDRQCLRDIVEGIDANRLLEERKAWLMEELGEVEGKLLNAAYESPGQLADHPHRGHPRLLASGRKMTD